MPGATIPSGISMLSSAFSNEVPTIESTTLRAFAAAWAMSRYLPNRTQDPSTFISIRGSNRYGVTSALMSAHNPKEIHSLFQAAFNCGDVEALLSLYEPDAILIVGGKQVTGSQNIKASFHSVLSVGPQMNLTTRSVIESRDGVAFCTASG